MSDSEFGFIVSQTIHENDSWKHVLSDKTLYITDVENNCVCKIKGKKQLLEMCNALGLVGTGVRL